MRHTLTLSPPTRMLPHHTRSFSWPEMTVEERLRNLLPDPHATLSCLDTPYSKYSNTNYAASGQDIHAISQIVSQRQVQLSDVTCELAYVEDIMKRVHDVHQQLLEKRNQIVSSMEAHQGLISCIRRLPSEILGEIFVRCLPPETHIEPDTRTAPLLLTRICRGWRKVALSTPRLWCSLSVRPSHRVQQQGLFFYHHWLSRARGCPLSLAVDTRRPPRNPVWRYEVTELLQPYTSRSERLHITFDEATAPDLLLKDIPMLEHLTLDGDMRNAQKISIVQPQSRLHSLTLNSVAFTSDSLSVFNPGWTNLTHLKVTLGRGRDIDGNIFLKLLQLCPNLEDYVFTPVCIGRSEVATYPPGSLTHPKLRSLDIVVLYGVGSLLDTLSLPSLRHLKVRDLDLLPSAWRHKEFKTFLSRSRCPLETLKIHGAQVSIKKEDRAEYAALIPTLKHLDLCLAVMLHG